MANAEFELLPFEATQPASAPTAANTSAEMDTEPLEASPATATADDNHRSDAPATGHPSRNDSAAKHVAPLGYQRLLLEHLRQALRSSDSAAAATAALPWLLQRFCTALRHQQTIAAAGAHPALLRTKIKQSPSETH